MGSKPYVLKFHELHPCNFPPFPFPYLGDYQPKGWRKTAEYFVDSSGFGSEGEPALTIGGFIKKLKVGFGYAITSAGQFQVHVGEYLCLHTRQESEAMKEVRAVVLFTKTIPLETVKALNAKGGLTFFSHSSTRYFNSRYPSAAYQIGNKAFFVTSERQSSSVPRRYTIRVCDMITGAISNVGAFCENTEVEARKLLRDTIRQEEVV